MRVKIRDIIGSETALAPSTGEPVHSYIHKELRNQNIVELDFSGMDVMTTAFLNAAIGQLYAEFDSTYLNKYLRIEEISDSDLILLKKVIKAAKDYFSDPEGYGERMKNHLNE